MAHTVHSINIQLQVHDSMHRLCSYKADSVALSVCAALRTARIASARLKRPHSPARCTAELFSRRRAPAAHWQRAAPFEAGRYGTGRGVELFPLPAAPRPRTCVTPRAQAWGASHGLHHGILRVARWLGGNCQLVGSHERAPQGVCSSGRVATGRDPQQQSANAGTTAARRQRHHEPA